MAIFQILDETKDLNLVEITNFNLPQTAKDITKIENSFYSENLFGPRKSETWYTQYAFINCRVYFPKFPILSILMDIPAFKTALKTAYHTREIYLCFDDDRVELVAYTQPESDATCFKLYELAQKEKLLAFIEKLSGISANYGQLLAKYLDLYSSNKDILVTNKLLVIPPGFRDYIEQDGRALLHPITNLYLRITQTIEQMKASVIDYYHIFLNQLVLLYDLLIKTFGSKEGMLRQKLASKVLNTTTRSVIIPETALGIDEIGVPLSSLILMYITEIAYWLLNQYKDEYNKILESNEFLKTYKQQFQILHTNHAIKVLETIAKQVDDDRLEPIRNLVVKILEKHVLPNAVVVYKRDPVLHRGSWIAARPRIAKSNAIEIPQAACEPLGGDFDGDSVVANITLYIHDKKTGKNYTVPNIPLADLPLFKLSEE